MRGGRGGTGRRARGERRRRQRRAWGKRARREGAGGCAAGAGAHLPPCTPAPEQPVCAGSVAFSERHPPGSRRWRGAALALRRPRCVTYRPILQRSVRCRHLPAALPRCALAQRCAGGNGCLGSLEPVASCEERAGVRELSEGGRPFFPARLRELP